MLNTPASSPAASSPGNDLETVLAAVELRLLRLGEALRDRNAAGIEREATELHHALAAAATCFAQAARHGGVPPALRKRLALTSGQVAAQRESLARATAALDRAIDVLMPGVSVPTLYGANGGTERAATSGAILA